MAVNPWAMGSLDEGWCTGGLLVPFPLSPTFTGEGMAATGPLFGAFGTAAPVTATGSMAATGASICSLTALGAGVLLLLTTATTFTLLRLLLLFLLFGVLLLNDPRLFSLLFQPFFFGGFRSSSSTWTTCLTGSGSSLASFRVIEQLRVDHPQKLNPFPLKGPCRFTRVEEPVHAPERQAQDTPTSFELVCHVPAAKPRRCGIQYTWVFTFKCGAQVIQYTVLI